MNPLQKRLALGLVAVSSLAMPATAQADFMAEMKAAGKVERKVTRKHPGWNIVAACDQYGRRKFWCNYTGSKGDCFVTGKARVKGSRIRLIGDEVTCF